MSDSELTKYTELQDKVEELGKENSELKEAYEKTTTENFKINQDLKDFNSSFDRYREQITIQKTTISEQAEEIKRLKEKEIRGDRRLAEIEHQKTVIKSDLLKAKELLKEAFDAGYDYRSSQTEHVIEQFGENSCDNFEEWLQGKNIAAVEQTKKMEEKFDTFHYSKQKVENQPEESKEEIKTPNNAREFFSKDFKPTASGTSGEEFKIRN